MGDLNCYIEQFIRYGVVVIPSVLSMEEVSSALDSLKLSLLTKGCDVADLENTASSLTKLSSTGGSGGILDIFYEEWKLRLNEHSAIVSIMQELWRATYAASTDSSDFSHPYGQFDPNQGYMYIDRVCYRVPSEISSRQGTSKKKQLQRSLTPHLDCCPHDMYGKGSKWRPIQAFIALTDGFLPEQGGFEACPGHHKAFDAWARNRPAGEGSSSAPCVGDFTPIRPVLDQDVLGGMKHIPCKAGDLVCWDYRIPHANSRYNHSDHARAVVYIGLLPSVAINERYVQEQLRRYQAGLLPTDQWHDSTARQECDYQFSELGKKLMGITAWDTS